MQLPTPAPDTTWPVVLVVDDEASMRQILARLLVHLGYQAVVASDAESALSLVQREPERFCCALIDVMMPRKSGAALARELSEQAPALPLVLMSGGASGDALDCIADLEVAAFLHKPFTYTDLERLLTTTVGQGRGAQASAAS